MRVGFPVFSFLHLIRFSPLFPCFPFFRFICNVQCLKILFFFNFLISINPKILSFRGLIWLWSKLISLFGFWFPLYSCTPLRKFFFLYFCQFFLSRPACIILTSNWSKDWGFHFSYFRWTSKSFSLSIFQFSVFPILCGHLSCPFLFLLTDFRGTRLNWLVLRTGDYFSPSASETDS